MYFILCFVPLVSPCS